MQKEKCVKKSIEYNNNTYNFQEVHLPLKKYSYDHSTSTVEQDDPYYYSHLNSIKNDSTYLYTILRPFMDDSESKNSTILLNYGFSGTGKTSTNKKLLDEINKANGVQLDEICIIYGAAGKEDSKWYGTQCGEFNYFKHGSITDPKILNTLLDETDNNVFIEKIITKFKKLDSTEYTYGITDDDKTKEEARNPTEENHNCGKGTPHFDNRNKTRKFIKKTMNNDNSSRFHMYFKFQKKEKFLYVFDLAGSEKLTDILSHNYNNEESNQQLKNIQTTTL